MTRIRAVDLPAPLLHAFVDALEAWVELEWELFQTWRFLKRPSEVDEAWKEFSDLPTWKQRENTIDLVSQHLAKSTEPSALPEVFERLADLTGLRDRIVHGRWHPIHDANGGPPEYIRLYDARGEFARPVDSNDEERTLGRSRFYEPQLRDAEQQFRWAMREVFKARWNLGGI